MTSHFRSPATNQIFPLSAQPQGGIWPLGASLGRWAQGQLSGDTPGFSMGLG